LAARRPIDNPERRPTADVRVATPQYFATSGVPVISGRVFSDMDSEVLSGIIACLILARRATTVDPLIALGAE